jgi:3-oxoacyl-[acyl-carrier-protein] synthase II
MMRKRVVVTGLGCVNPLGNNVLDTWNALMAGKSGAGSITLFDASYHKTKFAAEVKDFDEAALFGKRDSRRMDRFVQFALAASLQALEHSELIITDENRDRIGVFIGTGIGGINTLLGQVEVLRERGVDRISPFLVPMMLADTGPGMVSIYLGLRGPNMAIVTACATGSNAIGEAVEVIRRGDADVMLAGGSEAAIVPISMAGLNVMGALSTRNEDPTRASRPFEMERDGFVIGEGSAVLVLESFEYAQERNAHILAEVTGYGTSADAYHISAPAEDGEGASICMKLALKSANLQPEQIDYINAHGTSTILNDMSETAAIKNVFGEYAYHFPISSTKSMMGHLLGASGAIEALICVKIFQENQIPATINYETQDPECDLDYVPNVPRKAHPEHIMSNSFGFGGHNATLVISRFNG